MTEITDLKVEDLRQAETHSFYAIIGAGGDLQEWIDGYEKIFEEREVGKPKCWYKTTGSEVNAYAASTCSETLREQDRFPEELTILLFSWEDMNVGKLALVKLVMSDRWFDDVIAGMQIGSY